MQYKYQSSMKNKLPETIILVRHGESEKDKTNLLRKLTTRGKNQILKTADKIKPLAKKGESEIITTTTPRAVESAKIISSNLAIPIKRNFGNLRVENIDKLGNSKDELSFVYFEKFRKGKLPQTIPSPNKVVKRFFAAINKTCSKILVIVGHSGALETFTVFQERFIPDRKISKELRYGEFIVLKRRKW